MNNRILEECLANGLVDDCVYYAVKKYGGADFADDIKQDLCLSILEDEKIADVASKGKMNAWITTWLRNQLKSSHNETYRKYRKLQRISIQIEAIVTYEEE